MIERKFFHQFVSEETRCFPSFRPSDLSMKRSRSSLHRGDDHDSMGDLRDEKRRTYLVRYDEKESQNEDQPDFSTAV